MRYIALTAEDYIDHCMYSLGWETEAPVGNHIVPITPNILKTMSNEQGPLEGTPEAQALAEKFGQPYRSITGLLGFAVQLGRGDINTATILLSKFKNHPAAIDYTTGLSAFKFLRHTKKKPWVYWRPHEKEIPSLPYGDFYPLHPETDTISLFPKTHPLFEPEG